MSALPHTHRDRHSMRSFNQLYPGNATPRSTSPYSSQVNLSQLHPEHYPESLSVLGRLSSEHTPSENIVAPPSLTAEIVTPEERILPIAPRDVMELKYHRTEWYPSAEVDAKVKTITKLQRKFERDGIPDGWKGCVCAGGKLYFIHEKKHVVTLSNILDTSLHRRIEAAIDRLHPQLHKAELREDTELVVSATWAGDEEVVGYYVVDWETVSVVWFEDVKQSLVTDNERPPVSQPHLGLAVHAQFYTHMEIFPSHRRLPRAMIQELKDVYNFGSVDVITSDVSMFSYDPDTTHRLLRAVDRMDKVYDDDYSSYTVWIVARLAKTLYTDRFLAYYGEPGARLSRGDSAFKKSVHAPRSWIFTLLSPFLFFMPFVYLKELEVAFIDQTIHYYAWRRFIGALRRDWENAITPATVLLSANVGFLAIQSIDTAGGDKSMAQIASYISAILSLFIYVVCQILTRNHRHHQDEQAERAFAYLSTRQCRMLGLQTIAMAFSLPIALFIWSMIMFFAAMVFVFFDKTNLATKIALGAILGLLMFPVITLLYMEWDNDTPHAGLGIRWWDCLGYFRKFKKPREERPSDTDAPSDGRRGERSIVDEDGKKRTRSEVQINVADDSPTEPGPILPPTCARKKGRLSLGMIFGRKWRGRRGMTDFNHVLPTHQASVLELQVLDGLYPQVGVLV